MNLPKEQGGSLTALKGKGDVYSDNVRSKCKGSASEKRKLQQKINSIPQMKDDNAEKVIMELISNPQLSAIQIQKLLQKALGRDLSDANFLQLISIMIQKHKTIFGDKIQLDGNLKIEKTQHEWKERLFCMSACCSRLISEAKCSIQGKENNEAIKILEGLLNEENIEKETQKMFMARQIYSKIAKGEEIENIEITPFEVNNEGMVENGDANSRSV